ncbi:MAG: nucleotidyltransferase domain-containing protein [Bacteroidetes bacterium]|nr:nucleotidyltransferase domain-containing protein [Bacteroidota bacterium]
MHTEQSATEAVRQFARFASEQFRIRDVFLFGSYAQGTPREYSDIDVAIVSDDFIGDRFDDVKSLIKYMLRTSIDLEIHPFKTEDFTPDNPFVEEILRTGKRVQWN